MRKVVSLMNENFEGMIRVRKATRSDTEIIATYLLLAMEDIVYQFMGEEDSRKALAFMVHFVDKDNNQYSYQNCWVAEDNGRVVAAIDIYNGAQLGELRQPVMEYLRSQFNREFNMEDETQAGEYYIDSFGVDPKRQSEGIGTKLLQFAIDEYVTKRGQSLGLLVDEQNPNAKRLYVKLGFKRAGSRVLFGKRMEHLQIKG
jgi:ribosomal protein S18 acetylase RimI-like enzyme